VNIDYNSDRTDLIISEYGRHVQNLINYAVTIEDKEKRQAFANRIILLMHQMQPNNKNTSDYQEKLWKHMFRIADYKLDVEAPEGINPSPEDAVKKPDVLNYPSGTAKYRHYGNNVHKLVKKAIEMEDVDKKKAFTNVIGSYMKLAYRNWNQDHYVNDEVIKQELSRICNNELPIDENTVLDHLNSSMPSPSRNTNTKRRSNSGRRDDRRGGRSNGRSGGRSNGRSGGRDQRRRR
jgi:hypothetical protein